MLFSKNEWCLMLQRLMMSNGIVLHKPLHKSLIKNLDIESKVTKLKKPLFEFPIESFVFGIVFECSWTTPPMVQKERRLRSISFYSETGRK